MAPMAKSEQPGVRVVGPDAARGERHRPEAGEREQPEAGRPVGAGKPQIGEDCRGREAVDEVLRPARRPPCSFCLGQQDVACLSASVSLVFRTG